MPAGGPVDGCGPRGAVRWRTRGENFSHPRSQPLDEFGPLLCHVVELGGIRDDVVQLRVELVDVETDLIVGRYE